MVAELAHGEPVVKKLLANHNKMFLMMEQLMKQVRELQNSKSGNNERDARSKRKLSKINQDMLSVSTVNRFGALAVDTEVDIAVEVQVHVEQRQHLEAEECAKEKFNDKIIIKEIPSASQESRPTQRQPPIVILGEVKSLKELNDKCRRTLMDKSLSNTISSDSK